MLGPIGPDHRNETFGASAPLKELQKKRDFDADQCGRNGSSIVGKKMTTSHLEHR
jgi:hypothetical protein